MDPYKDKVLRKSYYSKITKKPKHKQVKVSKFESEEEAKAFLDKWKEEALIKERDYLEAMTKTNQENLTPDELLKNPVENPVVINTKTEPTLKELPQIEYTPFSINAPNFKKSGGGKSTIMIATSGSGKTTLCKYLIREYLDKPKEAILTYMCPSLVNEIYKPIQKNKNIIKQDFYNEKMIKDTVKINKKTNNKYHFMYILDDVIGDDVKSSKQLLKMFLTYRNVNHSCIVNIQDCKLIARTSRHNSNNIYFLKQATDDGIKDTLELFIGSYKPFKGLTMDEKIQMYRDITDNNGIIYLDTVSNKISFHRAVPEE